MKRSFDQLNDIGSKYLSLQSAFMSSACDESPRPILLRSWLQTPDGTGLAQMTSVDSDNINVRPNSGTVFIDGLSTHTPQTLTEPHFISASARSDKDKDNTQIDVHKASMIEIQFSQKDEELHRFSSDLSWRVFRHVKDLHSARKVRDRRESKFGRRKMIISKGGRRIAAAAQEIGQSSAQPLISPQIFAEREVGKSKSTNVSDKCDKRNGSTGDKSNGSAGLLGVEIVQR